MRDVSWLAQIPTERGSPEKTDTSHSQMFTTFRSAASFQLRCFSKLLALISIILFFAVPASAQGTGSIAGRVYDADTGRSLQGAVVRVRGTTALDTTDSNGRFVISPVPAGEATIDIEYVGLAATEQAVNVTAGSSATVMVAMDTGVVELEMLVVRAAAMGQALAINQQKTALGIVNIVSEEMFGQMTDGNIGQALQRLPGISVDEDQDGSPSSINIRGIAGEFNSLQTDGNRAPTSGGSRSFDPRHLSADGISNIEVIKAPTPDRDGDAIGGIINVVSRSAFQRGGREFKLKLSGVLNDIADNWGHSGSLSYSDLLSVGGGEKNLGVSFTLSSHNTDRYSLNRDMDWVQVDPTTNPELDLDGYDFPVWFMESTHWEYDTRRTQTYAISSSFDFRTDEFNTFYFRPLFSHYDRHGVKFESDIDIDTRFQNDEDGRKTYAELTPNYGRGTSGDDGSRGSRGWIGTDDERENDLYSFAFGGRHERTNNVFNYDLYYARSRSVVTNDTELNMLMEPDDPWFLFEYHIHDTQQGLVEVDVLNGVDPSDLSLMTEGELQEGSSEKTETVYSAKVDWERMFEGEGGTFALKTGAKFRSSRPEFDQTVNVYSMDEDFPYASVVDSTDQVLLLMPKYFDVYPRRGQELLRSNPDLFEFEEEDTLEDSNFEDYDAREETTAAYLMGTYTVGRHTVIGGVRWEQNEWSNTNKRVSYLDGDAEVISVQQGDRYSYFLPGLHFRHELKKNLILRESYNRSYGRPRLSELTSGRFINEDGDIVDGNPDLKPATSDNFDIQLEFYTATGGLYSAGIFYKDVKNFTFTQVYNFNDLDANGIPIPDEDGDFEYERPVNGSTAKNYGLELIARQRMFFLPDPLKGLSVALSATFTESEATYPNRTDDRDLPVEGFSDLLFTATVDYAWGNFRARIDYRHRGEYIEGLGENIESDEFFDAEDRVDAELRYRVREGLTIFVYGSNLTNEPQVSYQGYPQFVEDTSFSGRKYTVGVEYEF
jgi:TonB-dependent receptor